MPLATSLKFPCGFPHSASQLQIIVFSRPSFTLLQLVNHPRKLSLEARNVSRFLNFLLCNTINRCIEFSESESEWMDHGQGNFERHKQLKNIIKCLK